MTNNSEKIFDIVIIGGGIVGASVMYQIQKKFPHLHIALLEKEKKSGLHQTGRNSGVIHSGIYYKPGSLKAKNCIGGRKELVEFAKEHRISHDICGKIIVATKPSELDALEKIYQRGVENNIEGIEKISRQQIQEIEPHCTSAISGIFVGCTGIIDYVSVNNTCLKIAQSIQHESEVFFNCEATDIIWQTSFWTIKTKKQQNIKAKFLISCAGLQSDRIAQKTSSKSIECKIVPFRGDYYELSEHAMHKIKNLIYPVPDPNFPFLGVHFTRMIHGGVECGPNAVFSFKREGYHRNSFSLADTIDSLTYSGTWKLFSKHWRYGLEEYKRAWSKKLFLKSLQELIPSLTMDDIIPSRSGVRAQALDSKGNLLDDFKIIEGHQSLHVINAPSPAATASLSIGRKISELYSNLLK